MATVAVQLFASYADLLGQSRMTVSVPDRATVRDLLTSVRSLPRGGGIPETALVAVNRRFANASDPIAASDELALIPPVAGG
ncbi:MAG: MoaD/ThiS family protein [Gemmatimonadaceae bacterium]|nr:MoaD/ThiS family protein [Gemmatimonadaceae bacterium]